MPVIENSTCAHSFPMNTTEINSIKFLTAVNRITMVSIGILKVPFLFCTAFTVGATIAFLNNQFKWYEEKQINILDGMVSCALQSFENAAGQKFPKIVGLSIALLTTLHHLEHAAEIFGPISGMSLGMWAGSQAWHWKSNLLSSVI